MRGKNPIRPPLKGDGFSLDVKHIFPTLQGEGPFAGVPAVFLRLGGCNLACDFCDTDFEDFEGQPVSAIIERIGTLSRNEDGEVARRLVVITGGEPFRQEIGPLCETLLAKDYQVQIETNGTLYREVPEAVSIVCSPKRGKQGYLTPRPDLLARANALKFLVSANREDYGGVPELGQSELGVPVYVQPMDEYDEGKNRANRALAVALTMEKGYRLSLQLHKLLGIE
ncbi:MAG: 7-carboxy-7-deazaguanine synthase QueE [Alphaproteobacteria bacterium]|nr:7-carboxy-7-deazaguanine synthase QueE [Alphaproteobacteria bacterium]